MARSAPDKPHASRKPTCVCCHSVRWIAAADGWMAPVACTQEQLGCMRAQPQSAHSYLLQLPVRTCVANRSMQDAEHMVLATVKSHCQHVNERCSPAVTALSRLCGEVSLIQVDSNRPHQAPDDLDGALVARIAARACTRVRRVLRAVCADTTKCRQARPESRQHRVQTAPGCKQHNCWRF